MPLPQDSIYLQRLEIMVALWEAIDKRSVDFKRFGRQTLYTMKNGSHVRVHYYDGRVRNIVFFGRNGKLKSGMGVKLDE